MDDSLCAITIQRSCVNELGDGDPKGKASKFSVAVSLLTSTFVGLIFTAVILTTTKEFLEIFTKTGEVISATSKLGHNLAATIFFNSIQPVFCTESSC
ncbi:hypothetical protein SAY86_002029 [Trapa natans]|uniref:Uncharacterized protein n=1 Tax=Trapa natans TaxID=22666 RepID=A0AAN7LH49_TRANT|nr:hypothetical protein SAY86_002029 [Trapa natans]